MVSFLVKPFESIGIYTFDEIELNKKLRDACRHSKFDLVEIEKLLKAGANPLGGYNHSGWDLVEHIYGRCCFILF